MKKELSFLFAREFDNTIENLEHIPENILWEISGEIKNSPGNLMLHLCGGMFHNIGSVLLQNGYVRDREGEFKNKNIPKAKLKEMLLEAKKLICHTLDTITEEELQKEFPTQQLGYPMTTEFLIIHLYGHLNYHLGQINYFWRMYKK